MQKNTSLFEEKHKQKQNKKPNDYFEDQKQQKKKNKTKQNKTNPEYIYMWLLLFSFFPVLFLSQVT
jgi:hypothetical protein